MLLVFGVAVEDLESTVLEFMQHGNFFCVQQELASRKLAIGFFKIHPLGLHRITCQTIPSPQKNAASPNRC